MCQNIPFIVFPVSGRRQDLKPNKQKIEQGHSTVLHADMPGLSTLLLNSYFGLHESSKIFQTVKFSLLILLPLSSH
jgi:hypothetical protein